MTQSFVRMDPFLEEQAALSAASEDGQVKGRSASTGAPESLEEMSKALLELIVVSALAKGVTLPSRQSVYMAPIPADCEQVAVLFTGWNPTPATVEGTTICKPWRWIAPMSAIITRCTPAVPGKGHNTALKTVPVEKMVQAASIASDDSEVFLEVLERLGEIGADVSLVANPPQGGFQTVELNVPLISGSSFL